MAGDDTEPFDDETGPQYAEDLVNVDFPTEQEYKHNFSNWEKYQRQDFSKWDLGAMIYIARKERWILIWTLVPIFLVLPVAIWSLLFVNSHRPMFGQFVNWINWGIFLLGTVAIVFSAVLMEINKTGSVMARARDAQARLRGPVEPFALVGHFWAAREGSFEWLYKVSVRILLLFGAQPEPFGSSKLHAVLFKDLRQPPPRTLWFGGGQIQFGCGAKGFSVEHHGGYLYLLHWHKVLVIYYGDSPQDLSDVEQLEHPPDQQVRSEIDQLLSGLPPSNGWAPESIRIRLKAVAAPSPPGVRMPVKEPDDEIIIPRRFFSADEDFRHFFAECWKHKLASEYGNHGINKSAGEIEPTAAH